MDLLNGAYNCSGFLIAGYGACKGHGVSIHWGGWESVLRSRRECRRGSGLRGGELDTFKFGVIVSCMHRREVKGGKGGGEDAHGDAEDTEMQRHGMCLQQ